MIKYLKLFLKIGLPLGFGIYLTWYFFDQMSEEAMESFRKALREANYWIVSLSLLLGIVSYWSRAERMKYTLEPMGFKSNAWNRYHSLMIGYIVNLTIPRAGEASRALMLQRSDNIPFSKSFGTIITERIVDVFILGIITFLTITFSYDKFWELYNAMLLQFGVESNSSTSSFILPLVISIMVILLATVLIVKKIRIKLLQFAQSLTEGLMSIFKLEHPWFYMGHSVLIWTCYILMFALPYYALLETKVVPFEGIMMAFIAGSIGISFTNGGIGTYPLLVGFVTAHYLSNDDPDHSLAIANALGMLIWASQAIVMVVLGLVSLYFLPKTYSTDER